MFSPTQSHISCNTPILQPTRCSQTLDPNINLLDFHAHPLEPMKKHEAKNWLAKPGHGMCNGMPVRNTHAGWPHVYSTERHSKLMCYHAPKPYLHPHAPAVFCERVRAASTVGNRKMC